MVINSMIEIGNKNQQQISPFENNYTTYDTILDILVRNFKLEIAKWSEYSPKEIHQIFFQAA